MQNNDIKRKTFSSLFWRFSERSGAQIVQFIVSLVLARILSPNDYGTISLVLVFSQIFQVFVDSGLGNALIQKKDADDLDFSSVFYFNMITCLILYGLIFICSPYIASFYNNDSLTSIIRVLCLTIVVSGLKNVQQAYVSRNLLFKKFFFSTIGGTIVSAVVGIALAYAGAGCWALVAQKLVNVTIDTLILWITVNWKPKLIFSFYRLKELISYGWKLLASSLIDTLYTNLRQLLIGKIYTNADLAYYNQGNQFPLFIVTNINTSMDSVLLPVMSQEQDNTERVKNMVSRSIKISTFVMAPLMLGLAFCAEEIVVLLLTEKWLPCVFYLKIFCITYLFYPIHTANLNAIKSIGRSDLFLKLEIIKKAIGLIMLFLTINISVKAMAYSLLITSFAGQIVNTWPNKKLLNYSYFNQLKDIMPSILLAVCMGGIITILPIYIFSPIINLILKIIFGASIYIVGSIVFKNDSFMYLISIIKEIIKK